MIHTELKFVRILEELDEHIEEIQDLAGEHNSITDGCANFVTHDEHNNLLPSAVECQDEIDLTIESIEGKVSDIQKQLGLDTRQMDIMCDSSIMNRWEIYANYMGSEIISLRDISSGKI